MRKRTAVVTISGVLAGLALAACSGDPAPDYTKICKDARTSVRVEDKECDNGGSGGSYVHSYYPGNQKVPPVGMHAPSGLSSAPAGKTIGSAPAKGGFGTHAGTSGG